jgi:DNA-directed RNA polymerase subunit RPC12/RpoP
MMSGMFYLEGALEWQTVAMLKRSDMKVFTRDIVCKQCSRKIGFSFLSLKYINPFAKYSCKDCGQVFNLKLNLLFIAIIILAIILYKFIGAYLRSNVLYYSASEYWSLYLVQISTLLLPYYFFFRFSRIEFISNEQHNLK